MSEYNGWTNYETWCVNMWLSNDQGNYSATRDMTAEIKNQGGLRITSELADALKNYVEELPETLAVTETASFVSDLLGAAMGEVDWREIAANLLSEID